MISDSDKFSRAHGPSRLRHIVQLHHQPRPQLLVVTRASSAPGGSLCCVSPPRYLLPSCQRAHLRGVPAVTPRCLNFPHGNISYLPAMALSEYSILQRVVRVKEPRLVSMSMSSVLRRFVRVWVCCLCGGVLR
jgi:hypothetical protein